MSQTLLMLVVVWAALAVVVLALTVYHNLLARREDDHIHFSDQEAALVSVQTQTAQRIETIERWNRMLIIVLVCYGLALALYYGYTLWQAQSTRTIVD